MTGCGRRSGWLPPLRLLLLPLLLGGPGVGAAQLAALYSASDPLTLLQADTVRSTVLNSPSAWAVEFFASWCGHCIAFAPTWKALAKDIKDWRPALNLAALNCADETNNAVCRDFNIAGFPSVRFFKAFSKNSTGTTLPVAGANVQMLRERLIDALESHHDTWPSACPPLEPVKPKEIDTFFARNNQEYLVLIFEQENSYLGREVTLDLSQHHDLVVRRVLSTEANVVRKFGVADFPSCYLLFRNGSVSRVPVLVESRRFYTAYLQRLSEVTREGTPTPAVPTISDQIAPTVWKFADRSKIYMADLESALHYILRVEVGRFSVLEGQRLMALKKFVTVLTKYFPGQPLVRNFLQSTNEWLKRQHKKKMPYSFFKTAMDSRNEEAVITKEVNWVGCQGSESHFRGFPCSLWILFHFLTVQASQKNAESSQKPANGQEVLQAIRNYVRFFFGCRDCANHFEQMAAGSMHRVKSPNDAVLWLWTSHNRVNARLAGAPSEDPQFPKVQWPPPELCSACHNELSGEPVWDVDATLRFLKTHFSPSNIVLNFPPAEPASRSSVHSWGATPHLELDALGLVTRNSALALERAEISESPGSNAMPNIPAERPELFEALSHSR
ncbi:sulfhydryl oxidase 1 precursor [Cavia porcellus]|uniref:Sulfhydryl oxidase 1 n=1 Tax=Cavia porcellus TaxID=10141 RepID=QSOX1_CAVPO|nr:sulfhydryl oxidase 1 precursor [Cavia porcellus]O08841.2 RecName: Full=Sulfhydryl oxidase 1; AltName: Full=FAD-dependent sulfhydryl oxidase-3; Short=SOx-3; AltName: Full=Glandular epithelial cells protein 3; AltName: Full=Quiescin Q6; Flags: Precursor [Cavia porcellus]AAB58401.2 GEC-3 [Cavia porcellus]